MGSAVARADSPPEEPRPPETAFRRDTGPAAGPAREAGLECVGQLRLRRSDEIGGSRWGVSCHWIADEHPLQIEQRLEHLSVLGVKWAFLVPDWDRIECEKGQYDWNTPSHRLDDVVNGLVRRKVTPVIQIYGGNRLYMPVGADPNKRRLADAAKLLDDPEVRQAWHRFLEALVGRYQPHVKVWEIWNEPNGPWFWQTECGFPSSADTAGWGYGGAWDETKHAKWVLRRLLSDASLGMPVSIYFVLHDCPGMLEGGPDRGQMGINRKGLYWYGSWERKPAAHAVAHLSSLLDDRFEPLAAAQQARFEITASGSLTAAKTELLKTFPLKHKASGRPALVYWLGVPMASRFPPARVTLNWTGAELGQPVLVDLLDGRVYTVPYEIRPGQLRFANLPLADSPLVVCSRESVELALEQRGPAPPAETKGRS